MRKRSISRKRRTNESKGGNTHKYFSPVSKVNCRKMRRKTSNCETNFCLKGLRAKKRERNLVRVATYCTVPARSPRRLRLHARQILVLPFLIASCTRIRHDRVPLECCIFTAIQPICTLDGQEGQRSKKTLT